jgi:hypothetical protein
VKHHLQAPLTQFGKKLHSQNDEDGIIERIFSDFPAVTQHFVEIGIGPHWLDKNYENGIEGNCVLLKERGWSGLFLDAGAHPSQFGIKQEFVTPTNVNGLLRKYGVPDAVDLVSIDVDGQDLWIWLALDYRPTLIIVEYNPNFTSLDTSVTVPLDPTFKWDGTKYYGASLGALNKVAKDKGYKLVYANGVNAFFIRLDRLNNPNDFQDEELFVFLDQHHHDHFHRPWLTI